MTGSPWTTSEDQTMRTLYGKMKAAELGHRLGRTRGAITERARKLCLAFDRRAEMGSAFGRFFNAKYSEGWSDAEIAREWGAHNQTVMKWRHRKGLPSNRYNARHRAKIAVNTREQCRRDGVANLGELRAMVWSLRGFQDGWPGGMKKVDIDVLNALKAGPATRRTIGGTSRRQAAIGRLRRMGIINRIGIQWSIRDGKRSREWLYQLADGACRKPKTGEAA